MKAVFALSTIFSLFLLFANTVDSRKDMGEYWMDVKSTQSLLPVDLAASVGSNAKANCHTSQHFENQIQKPFVKDFESEPDVSIYPNDIKPTEQKSLVGDYEPNPDVTINHNDVKPSEHKSFVGVSEPKPDVTIYHNDIKPTEHKSSVGDFEPDVSIYVNDIKPSKKTHVGEFEPDVSIYVNDIKPSKKTHVGDFEPDVSVYVNDIKPIAQKTLVGEFEHGSDVTIYHNDIRAIRNHLPRQEPIKPDVSIYHN